MAKRKKGPSGPKIAKRNQLSGSADIAKPVTADDAEMETPKITFMDLPVEIRTQIYGYVLEEESPVEIEMRRHPKYAGGREVCRRNAPHLKRGEKIKGGRPAKSEYKPLTATSILYVSRQVYLEAEPVLYGSNHFSFMSTTALADFLEVIGNRTRHIRYVRIEPYGYIKSTIRKALRLLCAARGLRNLAFSHQDLHRSRELQPIISTARVAYDCQLLIKKLQKSYNQDRLSGDALDVVTIDNRQRWHSVVGKQTAENVAIQSEIRSYITECL